MHKYFCAKFCSFVLHNCPRVCCIMLYLLDLKWKRELLFVGCAWNDSSAGQHEMTNVTSVDWLWPRLSTFRNITSDALCYVYVYMNCNYSEELPTVNFLLCQNLNSWGVASHRYIPCTYQTYVNIVYHCNSIIISGIFSGQHVKAVASSTTELCRGAACVQLQ